MKIDPKKQTYKACVDCGLKRKQRRPDKRCMACRTKFRIRPIEERFFKYVKKTASCWIWTGGREPFGYGRFSLGVKKLGGTTAHRVSWTIKNGPIESGKLVLHKCDNPPCVNPEHLFIGDQKENISDCMRKGRWHIGERHGMAKLSEADVREIRKIFVPYKVTTKMIAKRFGVSQACIDDVIRRRWKHI